MQVTIHKERESERAPDQRKRRPLSLSIVALSRTTLTLTRFMISFIDSAVYLPLSSLAD